MNTRELIGVNEKPKQHTFVSPKIEIIIESPICLDYEKKLDESEHEKERKLNNSIDNLTINSKRNSIVVNKCRSNSFQVNSNQPLLSTLKKEPKIETDEQTLNKRKNSDSSLKGCLSNSNTPRSNGLNSSFRKSSSLNFQPNKSQSLNANNNLANPRLSICCSRRYSWANPSKSNSLAFNKKKKDSIQSTDCKIKTAKSDLQEAEAEFVSKISVLKNVDKNLKLGSVLSSEGQCAILKAYEDELYNQIKSRYKSKYNIARISTPEYYTSNRRNGSFSYFSNSSPSSSSLSSSSTSSWSSLSSLSSPSSSRNLSNSEWNILSSKPSIQQKHQIQTQQSTSSSNLLTKDERFQLKINKQIERAMSILDVLASNRKDLYTEQLIIKSYEQWHSKWNKLFKKNFLY
jgi:hypothetical protein